MRRITSRQNATVAEYRAAAHGEVEGQMLLDGPHLVSDALQAECVFRRVIVAADALDRSDIAPLVAKAEACGADVAVASASVMTAVSPVRSASPIAALVDRPSNGPRMFASPAPLVAVACDVQDPGNVGAIARVVEAAGGSGLIATGRSANPYGWKAARGSMGSVLRLPISTSRNADEAIAELRRRGCCVVATVPRGGRSLFDLDFEGSMAILIGAEGTGLSDAVAAASDGRITVPMQPPVESLNAAVTAALIFYEARRRRR